MASLGSGADRIYEDPAGAQCCVPLRFRVQGSIIGFTVHSGLRFQCFGFHYSEGLDDRDLELSVSVSPPNPTQPRLGMLQARRLFTAFCQMHQYKCANTGCAYVVHKPLHIRRHLLQAFKVQKRGKPHGAHVHSDCHRVAVTPGTPQRRLEPMH